MNRQREIDESDFGAGSAPARLGTDAPSFCLGHPSHTLQPGQITCHICGTLAANTEIAVYRVQKCLGMGRSGHAYLALHSISRQPVCIKVTTTGQSSSQQWEAARREVRSITALRHPAILPVFSCSVWQASVNRLEQMSSGTDYSAQGRPSSVGTSANSFLLTLNQYVPGTLPYFISYYQKRETRQQLQTRGISVLDLLLNLMMQIGSALQTAHSRSITHGAIVPGNILLASYERCWLADFGVAKLSAPPVPYLPPELYSASSASAQPHSHDAYWRSVTPASDQYMFAMLCQQLFSQILQPGEYQQFLPVLQRGTQPRVERRYGSIDQLLQDMELSRPAQPVSASNRQHISGANHNTKPSQRQVPTPESFARPVTPVIGLTPNPLQPATPAATSKPSGDAITPLPQIDTPEASQGAPFDADDWEKQGDKFFTQRAYDEALNAYHHAIEIVNSKPTTWLAMGDTYFALERYKDALMAYDQAMHLDPNDPQVWSSRGTVLDIMGRHQDAIDCYDRAEQLQVTS
jgi:serine/threonine protein kinase